MLLQVFISVVHPSTRTAGGSPVGRAVFQEIFMLIDIIDLSAGDRSIEAEVSFLDKFGTLSGSHASL